MTIVASSPGSPAPSEAPALVAADVALPVTGSSGIVALLGAALIVLGVALQSVRRLGASLRD